MGVHYGGDDGGDGYGPHECPGRAAGGGGVGVCAMPAPEVSADALADASGFLECAVCAAKPGSPDLCRSCLQNRSALHLARVEAANNLRMLQGQRVEIEYLRKMLIAAWGRESPG
jgi:hypothetical protein